MQTNKIISQIKAGVIRVNSLRQHPLLVKMLAWIIWVLATLFVVYEFVLDTSYGQIASQLKISLQLNQTEIGLLAAIFFYIYAVMQIPAGIMLDRLSTRWVLTAAVVCCATGTYIFSQATNMDSAEIGRLLTGFGSAFAFVAAGCLTARWFPASYFAIMFGLTQAIASLSNAASQHHVANLLVSMSWRSILAHLSVWGFILAAMIFIFIPNGLSKENSENREKLLPFLWGALKNVLGSNQVWMAALYAGLTFGIVLAFAVLWNIPLQKSYQISVHQAANFNALIFLGVAIGSPVIGIVSNLCKRRLLPMQISAAGTLFVMLGIFYLPNNTPHEVIAGLMFALGFFASASLLAYAIGTENVPNAVSGVAVGFINTFVFVIGGIMQDLPGHLFRAETYWQHVRTNVHKFLPFIHAFHRSPEEYHHALLLLPMGIIFAVVATFFIRETNCQPQKR